MFTVPTSMVYSVEATSKVAFLRVSEYELNLEEGDKIQVFCIYDRRFNQYRPGLHIGERYLAIAFSLRLLGLSLQKPQTQQPGAVVVYLIPQK